MNQPEAEASTHSCPETDMMFNNLSNAGRLVTLCNTSGRNEEKVCEGSQSVFLK